MRSLRLKSQNSLRTIAHKMGFSAPYLSDLERGRRNWTEGLMEAFRKACQ